MYDYKKSDNSRDERCYYVEPTRRPWTRKNFIRNITGRWNGQHRLLAATESPTISACTTATNLSSLDIPQALGSSLSFSNNRRMGTLEKNIRATQPEIEPLTIKQNGEKVKISIEDDAESGSIYNTTTVERPRGSIAKQVIAALSVSLVSLMIGFVSAYTSPAADSLMEEIQLTTNEFSWICGLMPLSALVGGLIGGPLIDIIGRKWTVLLTDLLFGLGWLVMGIAGQVWMLYTSRIISGLSVGISSLVLPVYLGETVQPEVRGSLGLLPTAFGNIGILVCYIAGSYLKWNHLAWCGIVFTVPFLFLAFLIPETPRWYISKGREEEARKALQWLRGDKTDITDEFTELKSSQEKNDETSSSLSDLFANSNAKPLLISLGLMFFQQMSGINAVIFYTTKIFEMAGSTIDNNLCTIIVGIVNFISTFIATVLIDRLGRKVLLYISSTSMIVTLCALGGYFYLAHIKVDVSQYGWMPLANFVIYILGFSLGFGPIPWLMMGEILPAKIRGPAASLATSFNWTFTFIVTKTFVNVLDILGAHGTFWLFAAIIAASLLFTKVWVPETRGRSLSDIEKQLSGAEKHLAGKVRRMSSVANMRPLPSSF